MPPFQDLEEIPLEPKPYHPTVSWMLFLAILALGGAIYLSAAELQFYVSAAAANDPQLPETSTVIDGEYGAAVTQAEQWLTKQRTDDKAAVQKIVDGKLDFELPSEKAPAPAAGKPGGQPATR